MNYRTLKRAAATLTAGMISASIAANANAALIGINDPLYGAGQDGQNITLDTDTGLEWLDVTLTTNRSYNDIAGQFGSGGDFTGWRHATAGELIEFFGNAGLPAALGEVDPGSFLDDEISAFLDLTGKIHDGSTTINLPVASSDPVFRTNGAMFDGSEFLPPNIQSTSWAGITDGQFALRVRVHTGEGPGTSQETVLGHWLVREASTEVSAPGGLALFVMSLAVFGALRRRRLDDA